MGVTDEAVRTGQGQAHQITWRSLCMRFTPSLTAALVYFGYIALWHFHYTFYLSVISWFDAPPGNAPYGDLGAVLMAIGCAHQGASVLVPNACMHGGMFNYSPLLLHVPLFTLSPRDVMPAGLLSGMIFIAACAGLPPPRNLAALGMRCVALCSCAVTHALESGNIDALIFVICVAGLLLVQVGGIAALVGYAVVMAGGATKFYPAALLVLVLRERRPVFIAIAAFITAAGLLFLLKFGNDLVTILTSLPAGLPFAGVFGAMNVPFGFALLMLMPHLTLHPNVPEFFAAVDHPYVAPYIALCTKALVIAGIVSGFQLSPRYQSWVGNIVPDRLIFLVGGAALLSFCFDLTGNFDYRGIFLLLPLAGLGGTVPAVQDKAAVHRLQVVILFLLWDRFLRRSVEVLAVELLGAKHAVWPEIAFWLVREYCWWWLVVRLSAIVIAFIKLRLPSVLPNSRVA